MADLTEERVREICREEITRREAEVFAAFEAARAAGKEFERRVIERLIANARRGEPC